MTIKCILFDLDGVLINTHKIQVEATLLALKKKIEVNKYIKNTVNETTTTKYKLRKLSNKNYFRKSEINNIYNEKIKIFEKIYLTRLKKNIRLIELFKKLKKNDLRLGIVTNANKNSTLKILKKIGIIKLFDCIITNNDVKKNKPFPDPYIKAMKILKVKPNNTIIYEDSVVGILSAKRSKAKYKRVTRISYINYKNINKDVFK